MKNSDSNIKIVIHIFNISLCITYTRIVIHIRYEYPERER